MAVNQSIYSVTDTPSSRASPLPHLILAALSIGADPLTTEALFALTQLRIRCGKNRLESLVIKLLSSRTPMPAA